MSNNEVDCNFPNEPNYVVLIIIFWLAEQLCNFGLKWGFKWSPNTKDPFFVLLSRISINVKGSFCMKFVFNLLQNLLYIKVYCTLYSISQFSIIHFLWIYPKTKNYNKRNSINRIFFFIVLLLYILHVFVSDWKIRFSWEKYKELHFFLSKSCFKRITKGSRFILLSYENGNNKKSKKNFVTLKVLFLFIWKIWVHFYYIIVMRCRRGNCVDWTN